MMMANLFKNILVSRQQIRFLPRFTQLKPEKNEILKDTWVEENENIISNEPFLKNAAADSSYKKIKWKTAPKQPKTLVIKPAKSTESKPADSLSVNEKTKSAVVKENVFILDREGNLVYTKMGNKDTRITEIMANVKTQNRNKKNEFILLEGKKLIMEALEAGCKLEYILFSRKTEVENLKSFLPKKGKLYKMPYREMQCWSNLTTSPGIMGIFHTPPADFFEPKEKLPLTIICDNVREPSNLGAIMRTSSGVGCDKLILTKGCANVWESKVLRSACGAHFRLQLSKDVTWDDIRSSLPKNTSVFIADNNTVATNDENLQTMQELTANVPVLPYFSVTFKSSTHIVLIIGGETEGISVESYKLAKDFNGARLNVPLSNGVESLNTGTALGIIAFEIKRQLTNIAAEG